MKIDISKLYQAPLRYQDIIKPRDVNSADRLYINDEPWIQVRNYTDTISSYSPRYPSTLLSWNDMRNAIRSQIDTLYPFF